MDNVLAFLTARGAVVSDSTRIEEVSVGGTTRHVVTFDASSNEDAIFTVPSFPSFQSDAILKVKLHCIMASATSGDVDLDVAVEAVTAADSVDLDAATSFDTANSTDNTTVPGTAGHLFDVTVTLTNKDSVAAGDYVRIKLTRDASSDTATGDLRVLGGSVFETITDLQLDVALTVNDVKIDGKVITMTGSTSDTAVLTAGTNGTLSIVTTDAAAAAANIQITADGTVDIDSAGVLTLDSGAAINLEPAAGSAILLDGTISVDAGVVTGATSITSTAFVGALTGNADTVTNGVYTSNNLSVMAATTSAELAGIISNETGSGSLVFATSPTLVTPALGTPSALVGTNISGTAASLTAGAVTNGVYTSNNLSVMAATTSAQLAGVISDETGSGALVFGTSPTLVTPALGTPSALVGTNISGTAANLTVGAVNSSIQNAVELSPHGTSAGNTGEIRFLELAANGTNYVGFKSPDATAGQIYVLPAADGSDGQQLTTDGDGTLSWAAAATAAGTPTTITVADTTDTTAFVALFESATGDLGPKTDAGITYNAGTGTLTATAFSGPLTGNVTGNASGTALTVTQAAQTAITSLGDLTALTVDDVVINGKVITMTGSTDDTAVFTAGTNGTLSIVTTDTAAAAANIQITADGTVDIDSAGVLTLDSGAAINIEPASGSAILLDGTISVDAGVVTGATSITSTAFVGALTGNADTVTNGVYTSSKLNVMAATTSAELRAVISDETGSGSLVFANTPTLITPALGTPASGNLANCTFPTLNQNTTGTATIATTVTVADESSDATCFPLFVTAATGNLGPKSGSNLAFNSSSGALTATSFVGDITGDVTGNADTVTNGVYTSNNLSVMAATTSAQLASVISNETGSGALVFGTSPTLVTPALGTPSALVGTNISGTAASLTVGAVTNGVYTTDSGTVSNTMLANSSITVSDGSNTSPVALGGTMTFSGTTNEVTVVESAGTVTIGLPDDVTISGDLTVNGDTVTVNTATLSVEDPLIILASGNSSADVVDIGFYGLYDTSGSLDLYAGLFRDANDSGKFKLFKDLQAAPTTTVNTSGTGYAKATLVADIEGALTGNADTVTNGVYTSSKLSVMAATTSTELRSVISDETGTGSLVFATSPTLVTPALGTPSALVGTNISGTAASLTAGAVTNGVYTSNNLSVMAATTSAQLAGVISDETGSGSLVFATSPTLVTPALGTPASGNLANCTFPTLNQNTTGTATIATTVTVADESSDATCFPLFVTAATGNLGPKSGSNLAFNSSSGALTATSFVGDITGDVTGNADTVTNGVYTSNNLSVMAATTSAQLASVISDETGSGSLVFATSPTLVTPALGTPSALVGTNISGTAASLTVGKVTVSDSTANTAFPVAFHDESNALLDDTGAFTYNPSSSTVVATTFSGALSGNATTATALATARAFTTTGDVVIASTNFDGSANFTAAATIQANSVDGTMIALGSDTLGDIMYYDGTNYVRLAAAQDGYVLTATGVGAAPAWEAASGGGGTPTAITVADTTDTTSFVALFESATGDLGPKTDAGITYNAGTGTLAATAFSGPLTGNVTGNASGTALTVTQAAQTAITSVGTLVGLAVEKNAGSLATFKRITGSGSAYITIDSSAVNDDEDAQLRLKAGVAGKCRVYFGDTADSDIGQICYEHSDNSLGIKTNNTTAISISSAQVAHFGGAITQAPNTATDGGAVDIDCSISNYHEILMNADATSIVFTNAIAGQRIVVRFKQHSSHIDLNASEGWNSVTVNGSSGTLHWAGGFEPTLTESNNAIDVYGFLFTSTVTTVHGFIIGQDIKA